METLSGRAGESGPASTTLDTQTIGAGEEVQVEIAPPLSPKLVSALFNYLQTIPETKIMHTHGTWDKGVVITVMMDKPAPLVKLLSNMGTVAPVTSPGTEGLLKDRLGGFLRQGKGPVRRLKMTLKEPQ